MNKLYFIVALAVVELFFATSTAQKTTQTAITDFKPSWFIGANGGINWYLAEGNDIFDKGSNKITSEKLGSQLNGVLGYNFSSVHALRGMIGYNQFKYNTENVNIKIPHAKLNLDYVLNLTNLVKGYDQNRIFTFSLFAGLGGSYIDRNAASSNFGAALRGGIQGDFHLTPKLALNVILDQNFLTDNSNDLVANRAFDMNTGLSVGLTYRFQKNESVRKPAPELVVPVEKQTEKQTEKPVEKPVENKKPEVIKPVAPEKTKEQSFFKKELFFHTNNTTVSETEQEDILIQAMEYLKSNPNAKLTVSGYADRNTGSNKTNERVSKERANNTATKLIEKYGVNPKSLIVKWHGSKVQPFEENEKNRVVIIDTKQQK